MKKVVGRFHLHRSAWFVGSGWPPRIAAAAGCHSCGSNLASDVPSWVCPGGFRPLGRQQHRGCQPGSGIHLWHLPRAFQGGKKGKGAGSRAVRSVWSTHHHSPGTSFFLPSVRCALCATVLCMPLTAHLQLLSQRKREWRTLERAASRALL